MGLTSSQNSREECTKRSHEWGESFFYISRAQMCKFFLFANIAYILQPLQCARKQVQAGSKVLATFVPRLHLKTTQRHNLFLARKSARLVLVPILFIGSFSVFFFHCEQSVLGSWASTSFVYHFYALLYTTSHF